jgi:RimJ/RimL family protein N-acetyltransferase
MPAMKSILCENDALKSCHWRNDPDIWAYTGSKPDCYVTEEIEIEWIRRVLNDETSHRFAICITGSNEYIGNVQLTDIQNGMAQFHIFIGNKLYWGRGVSTSATGMILNFAQNSLNLKKIHLEVNKMNLAAIKSYKKNGFKVISSCCGNYIMHIDLPPAKDA